MKLHAVWLMGSLFIATASAGSLDPPGAPESTPSLAEPRIPLSAETTPPGTFAAIYQIEQPGSYYLTENLQGEAAKYGIVISSAHVTIDLNGFSLIGVPGSLDGIRNNGSASTNSTVRNGYVTGWGASGISISAARVENVTATNNGEWGIQVSQNSVVSGCIAEGNVNGISVQFENGVVENCVAVNNTAVGLEIANNTTVTHCSLVDNTTGIDGSSGNIISECAVTGNSQYGMRLFDENIVRNNTVTRNSVGITARETNTIDGNLVVGNSTLGITISGNSNAVVRNHVRGTNLLPTDSQAGPLGTPSTATSPWANLQ